MKIVLIRPNYESHIITPPLALGYLSSYLKKSGIDTVIIDGLKENMTCDRMVDRIRDLRPDAAAITCLSAFYRETVSLSRELRKSRIRTILGGPHPTFLPYRTLVDAQADYVICGEGEIPLRDLVIHDFVNNNIQGVYSLNNLNDERQDVIKASVTENLDDLPFPDWAQMNPGDYPPAPHGGLARGSPSV